jgi:type II secretory pathway component GspD/PulD (secretin)
MQNLVRDGQTLVLGGFIRPKTEGKKMVMFLVTPYIVDPAGNRMHTDEELSAIQKALQPK